MPPKKTIKKIVAASKTKEAAKAIPTSAQTNDATTAGMKRGRAESVGSQPASKSKKKKADHPPIVHEISDSEVEEIPPPKESAKTRAIDKTTKEELDLMEEILSYFIMPAFTDAIDAMNLPKTPRPDAVPECSKFILEELERRFKAGHSIEKECTAIKKIEEKFEAGEYDEDPEGFDRIVRRRINKIEEMVERMTSMYLRDIIKELGFYPRGGSNRDLGEEIVSIVSFKAKNGSKLVGEYKTVKSYYGSSYGGCGDGNDSLEGDEEDDEEGDDDEEVDDESDDGEN